jgi:hypothetical protein
MSNYEVSCPSCSGSYTSLGSYNQGYGAAAMAPVSAAIPSMATQLVYVTPNYGGTSYSAMSSGNGRVANCGYFNLTSAYGSNCGSYASRACAGVLRPQPEPQPQPNGNGNGVAARRR